MRRFLMLAAMLIAPAMAPQPAEAGDRGHGFRHSPPPLFTQPRFSHYGKPFHFGHRPVIPRHFGHPRPVMPRHFGHSRGTVLFKFHSGGFGFKHGLLPPARPHHFHRPHHRAPALTFGRPSHVKDWGFSRSHHKSWRGRSHRHR